MICQMRGCSDGLLCRGPQPLTSKPTDDRVVAKVPTMTGPHWVIFDWASRRCLSSDVRFAPKATEVLRCREMTRWAKTGSRGPHSITSLA